jgi:hypothetical protein
MRRYGSQVHNRHPRGGRVCTYEPLRLLTGHAPPGRGTIVPFGTLTLPTQPPLMFAEAPYNPKCS